MSENSPEFSSLVHVVIKEEPAFDFEDESVEDSTSNFSQTFESDVKTEVSEHDLESNKRHGVNIKCELKTSSETESDFKDECPYMCNVCKKDFENEESLEEHKKIPVSSKTFTCCACPKSFRDMSQLNVHTR